MKVKFKKLSPTAAVPTYATKDSACADLCINEDVRLGPGEHLLVQTGLVLELEPGYECQIRPRSGLQVKRGVACHWGTVDADYRGEVMVFLMNRSSESQSFKRGDRIAQIKIERVEQAQFVEVEELNDTARGTGGFGSTGT